MTLEIPCEDELTAELWSALIEASTEMPTDWTLVGAQMVFLHGLEHGRTPPRRTSDLDVVVNVRALSVQPRQFVDKLRSLGYELEGISADNVGHRFVRGRVKFDVLLTDGIGHRASREVLPGVRSVEVPGGTQALQRSVPIEVQVKAVRGVVQRPSLLGAILVKARAVEVDDLPDAQREDLAFLLSLVADPFELAGELRATERKWLRRRKEMFDANAPAWRVIDRAGDGRAALGVLAGEGD